MIVVLFLALFVLLIVSAFLSSSETALFSLSFLQLKSYRLSSQPRFKIIAALMDRPKDVLVTILMLNVLANILVQNVISSLFDQYDNWFIKVGVPLGLTLIFGELLPKSIAMPNNEKISYAVSPWISKISRWLGPVRRQLTALTSWISRFFFLFMKKEKEMSSDELRHVLQASEKSKVLLKQESRLIGGALDLQQMLVKERMRPREEILFYNIEEPLNHLLALFVDQQITRIPVCVGNLENLKGILCARDFFLSQPNITSGQDLLPLLKKAYYVPETIKAFSLLKILRQRATNLAIVVDEYGSISGLITQEDIIEGVVGEISDRRDTKSLYTRSGDDIIIASGKMELSEFKDVFGVALESEENVLTIGGWLTEQLGTIPQTGTQYATDAFLFYVLAADPNRVRRVYIRRLVKRGPR